MRSYHPMALLSLLTLSFSVAPQISTDWATPQLQSATFSQLVAAQSQIEGDKRPYGGSSRTRTFVLSHKTMTA